jgi:indolepyruvate ferredoxin oxidoreductase beta subunit
MTRMAPLGPPRYERRTKILLIGVGGQGVVTAAEVLGRALRETSPQLGVCAGQLHGLAQRGGSVESTVALGEGSTAFVGPGEADVVLGFEPLETLRALPRMHAETRVVLNIGRIAPFALARSGLPYPDVNGIVDQLRSVASRVSVIDGPAILHELGEPRCLNNVMLGALVGLNALPVDAASLGRAVVARYGRKHEATNVRAIELGRAAVAESSARDPQECEVPE